MNITKEMCLVNSSVIGKRFMKYLEEQIDDMGLRNYRHIIKLLRTTSSAHYLLLIEYAEVKVRLTCSTLSGVQGTRILDSVSEFLQDRFGRSYKDNLISAIVPRLNKESLKEAGMKKIMKNQRYYLQAIAEAVEVIAAIKYQNDKLVLNPMVNYHTYMLLGNDLIHPGEVVCKASSYLRRLITARNLQDDLAGANIAEMHNNAQFQENDPPEAILAVQADIAGAEGAAEAVAAIPIQAEEAAESGANQEPDQDDNISRIRLDSDSEAEQEPDHLEAEQQSESKGRLDSGKRLDSQTDQQPVLELEAADREKAKNEIEVNKEDDDSMEVDTPPHMVQLVHQDHGYALPVELLADHEDQEDDEYKDDLEDNAGNEADDPNENMEALLVQEAALDLELFAEQEQEEVLDLGEFEIDDFFPVFDQGYYSATEE